MDEVYNNYRNKIGYGKENILIYENILSEQELSVLSNFARKADYSLYSHEYEHRKDRLLTADLLPKNIISILIKIFNYIKDTAEKKYGVKLDDYKLESIYLNKWPVGTSMGEHSDEIAVFHYNISSLFYINDDYTGGEINFPQHGVKIKPKANSAVIFPSNENYYHEVLEVFGSERYTTSLWFKFFGSTYVGRAEQ